ncbi:MAG TPA: hypothetical protein VGS19_03215 [Streptosporangiaceae bacterium]|nr:hypothetical protein [Streptosporangiaceae bacterium]
MRILVLQQPHSVAPFERWLHEASADVEVRIVTGEGTARADETIAPGVRRDVFGDYESDATTRQVFELCAQWRPEVVFSNSEADVLRAAEARVLFGIGGMTSASAVLFRDKVAMKQLFSGLPAQVAPYRVPTSAEEVIDACDELGMVVVKPRDGAGSAGVQVFGTPEEASRFLATNPGLLGPLHRSQLILEKFVHGDVYHVDILVRDGEPILVSPSKYLAPPHLFRQVNVGAVMTDVSSADHGFLAAYARGLVRQVAVHQPNILHLEMYRTPGGEFVAGEVACRGGGGLIKESMKHTYGVDQAWAACLLAAGLLPERTFLRRTGQQSGYILETAHELALDPVAPPEWVALCRRKERPGTPGTSCDAGTQLVVAGDSHDQILGRMTALNGGRTALYAGR